MIDIDAARSLAEPFLRDGHRLGEVKELAQGWFFAFTGPTAAGGGSQGVVVNKKTGRVFELGSAFPVERDLRYYDLGYQFQRYDLVVTAVHDWNRTLNVLEEIGPVVIDATYESGSVWRVPRRLTKEEIKQRLAEKPCIFGNVGLYFRIEVLEAARLANAFEFEVLEYSVANLWND